jgi:Amt family ammonium transporter
MFDHISRLLTNGYNSPQGLAPWYFLPAVGNANYDIRFPYLSGLPVEYYQYAGAFAGTAAEGASTFAGCTTINGDNDVTGQAYKCTNAAFLNSGDTAWILTSCALVLFMSIPGLALYYSGLVRQANVLTTSMQTLSITCFITFMWFFCGYSLSFAPTNPYRKTSTPIYGDGSRLWFRGMKYDTAHILAPTIPETVYCLYQLTFAIITPALICGSFADRMKYWPMVLFMCLWHVTVYCPLAHANWHPDGFLFQSGSLDFAGGNVVHISSGIAGLVSVAIVGNRRGFNQPAEKDNFLPSNILTTFTGAMMLWVGWLGFNGGAAGSAGLMAGQAVLNTHLSAATGAITWMLTEVIFSPDHKPKFLGMTSGVIAGLVGVTPGAGFMDQNGAFWSGFFAGIICYFGAQLKHYLGYDDALDAFGVHAIGGIVGGISVGFFATRSVGSYHAGFEKMPFGAPGVSNRDGVYYSNLQHGGTQLGVQIYAIVVAIGWSAFMSAILLLAIDKTLGLRVSAQDEDTGLDDSIHGESLTPKESKPYTGVSETEMTTA